MLPFALTIVVFAVVMLAMSVGVLFNNRCLRGSCGGPDVVGADGESLLCASCPKRRERQESQKNEELVGIAGHGAKTEY